MKPDGGPAFPFPVNSGEWAQGLTLRDYFAAAALQGLLAHGCRFEVAQQYAYESADAMLAERDK